MLARVILLVTLLGLFTIATPIVPSIKKYAGEVIPGSYIVKLRDGASPIQVAWSTLGVHKTIDTFFGGDSNSVFNGFTAKLSEEELKEVLKSLDVQFVEENGILHAPNISHNFSTRSTVTQVNAPWNLARLSQDAHLGNPPFTYTYSSVAGSGVDIYVLDTGVFIGHSEFGGRASWGATFGGYPDADGNGHGTHIAGIAAGSTFGVAKRANIIAVKVLSDAGSGSITDIVSGLSFVVQNAKVTGRKATVLLAVGGSPSTTLDSAVVNVINSGIPVVVVAGSSNTDASSSSPARVVQAITVSASTQSDSVTSFSNFGPVIDLYAPGQNIISAWIGNPTAVENLSGVSMAGAHVAGLAAYLLGLTGSIPAATVADDLVIMSVKNILAGVPTDTPNRLASNNVSRIGIAV